MDDVQSLSAALLAILHDEVYAYQHFAVLQETEKRHLVTRNLEAFLGNLHAKEHCVLGLRRLEEKRQAMVMRLAALLRLDAADVTLAQLSANVPEPAASELLASRSQLKESLDLVQRCNRDNVRLLQDSLALIKETLAFFTCLLPARLTYQRSGTFPPSTQGRLLSGRV